MVTSLGVAECDYLGDQNVWSTLFELESDKEIIMVATKVILLLAHVHFIESVSLTDSKE